MSTDAIHTAMRAVFASAGIGPCTFPMKDGGSFTLVGTAIGELAVPSRTLGFECGDFADLDRWASASDHVEVLAFHSDSGSLEAWVVRSPEAGAIVRWVDGGFEDRGIVGDRESVEDPSDEWWPEGEIAIANNAVYVNGPDLSVAWAYLGLDADDRAVALVVMTA